MRGKKNGFVVYCFVIVLVVSWALWPALTRPAEWPLKETSAYDLEQISRIKAAILEFNSGLDPEKAKVYATLIWTSSKVAKLDCHLAMAVVKEESNFEAQARSSAGAIGLMQIMPETGRGLGAGDLFNPSENIPAGIRYLKYLVDRYRGNEELAVAAYNAGTLRVKAAVPDISETRHYVRRVMATYRGLSRGRSVYRKPSEAAW
ncbi:MAG: lytic transglycosylase domain-containing protein [Firmicutes bacterium]|nr:lytic transglycosylase domain-containing protein [Bacillota bacterium]